MNYNLFWTKEALQHINESISSSRCRYSKNFWRLMCLYFKPGYDCFPVPLDEVNEIFIDREGDLLEEVSKLVCGWATCAKVDRHKMDMLNIDGAELVDSITFAPVK